MDYTFRFIALYCLLFFAPVQAQNQQPQDIEILRERLRRDDKKVCIKTLKSLAAMKEKALPVFDDLIGLLDDDNFFVNYFVSDALVEIGGVKAVFPLIAFSDKPHFRFRSDSISDALIKIGKPAIPYLISALETGTCHKKQYIINAIGRIFSPYEMTFYEYNKEEHLYGVDGLLKSLNNKNVMIRSMVLDDIGKIPLDAVPILKQLLDDENAEVREEAQKAIDCILHIPGCRIVRELYIPELTKALDDQNPIIREFASHAIWQITNYDQRHQLK